MRHYNIPIFIPHLGCPFDCIYCDQKIISSQIKPPDEDEIKNIIDSHLSTLEQGAEVELAFFGGSFTAIDSELQERYLKVIQPYIDLGLIQSIRCSTRPDYIDEKKLDLLESYRVKTIELGVQSLSDNVLKASARGYKAEDVFKSSYLIKERHLKLGIQLMIGLPGDSYSADIYTVKKAMALKPDMVRLYPTLVIKGTVLERMLNDGRYMALTIDEAVERCKDMLLLFQSQDIDVIRMGLYPGEDLRSEGVVRAGPFHSSFGELVEQAIFKEQAAMVIKQFLELSPSSSELNLHVNSRDVSKMTGKGRKNILDLIDRYKLGKIRIKVQEKDERDWVGVSDRGVENVQLVLGRKEYINKLSL